ncbi:hypothetical protein [Flammeovirga sp. SubArs3]|uniref:hypothetical protein n=1 Tax=Flammeovirga sp. SubArs3 TaxID=2995316 RepID=UPI00248D0E69|nr:hypothetical protein [Flammeovirga sp. SubArs3]
MSTLKIQLTDDNSILRSLSLSIVLPVLLGVISNYLIDNLLLASLIGMLSFGIFFFLAIRSINRNANKYIFEVKDQRIYYKGLFIVEFKDIKNLKYKYSVSLGRKGFTLYGNRNFRFLIIRTKSGACKRLNLSSTSADVNDIITRVNKEIAVMRNAEKLGNHENAQPSQSCRKC